MRTPIKNAAVHVKLSVINSTQWQQNGCKHTILSIQQ